MEQTSFVVLGLGSRSTLFYLKELNKLYNDKKDGYSTCPFFLLNTNFDEINPLLPNTSKQLDIILQSYINKIEKLNTSHILIPNITLHETIDRLVIQKKIIHPLDLSVSKIKQNNWTKVVLFGSLHSMKSTYIRSHFELNDIEVICPNEKDMLVIDEVRKQIYSETETKDLIDKYHLIIEKYSTNNPVILACTELSILKPLDNKNIIDMAQVQIEEAIESTF